MPDDHRFDSGTTYVLWSAGAVSLVLVLVTLVVTRRPRPSDVVINIVVHLLLLATVSIVPLFFAISILALPPVPALLASLWGVTRPPPRPFSM